jgi:hypothetical protein
MAARISGAIPAALSLAKFIRSLALYTAHATGRFGVSAAGAHPAAL